jgi:hypothetical protein
MRFKIILFSLLVFGPLTVLKAYDSDGYIGWFNGDRQFGISGWSNWYMSETQYARVYDNFVVPDGGWIVSGVFSNNSFYEAPPVTQAAWEIRELLAAGSAGPVVASGINPAAVSFDQTFNVYHVEVGGLQVTLAPGHYLLNVVPVGLGSKQSYLAATLGANAVGNPAGNDGGALYSWNGTFTSCSSTGSAGTSSDFSQGVLISGSAGTSGSLTVSDQWRANVESLVQQMPLYHSLPFPGINLDDFKAEAAELYNRIPDLSDPEIRTELTRLVASIGDSHTNVSWPYPRPFYLAPLSFYWFDDGIYITSAAAQYQELLGGKVEIVGETGIDAATDLLSTLIPHENDQWVKLQVPKNELTNADYMFGTGLIRSIDYVPLQVRQPSGSIVSANVQTYTGYSMPQQIQVFQGALPLYRQYTNWNYWATVIDGGATLYFQYNSCAEDSKQPSSEFFQQLDQMMAQPSLQRIVLDMRNNSGGTTSILNPWIGQIRTSRFNQPGRLYVIVGRATFSAAMEATNLLHDNTTAIFVGESTGAKPRFQLRRGDFALPYFGIRVSYSRGAEAATVPDATLTPDIPTGLTFQQYMNGIDPALDTILSMAAPRPAGFCTAVLNPGNLNISAVAGNYTIEVRADSDCPWKVSSLPSWIAVSGTDSGFGSGRITLSVTANSGGQRGSILSVGDAPLPVMQQGPASCAYSLSAAGQDFASAAGAGAVNVTASSGCSWLVLNPLNWVTFTDGLSGTGSGNVSFTLAANSGAMRWGTIYLAGVPFTIQQSGVSSTSMIQTGSMANIASGGGWNTTFTLVNLGTTDSETQLRFLDGSGAVSFLPYTWPQQPLLGPMSRGIFDGIFASNATLLLDSTGPVSQPAITGSTQLLTNGNIDGFSIFTDTSTGQAAVAPLEKRNAGSYLLPFDNTGNVWTGVAVANLASAAANVNVVIRNDSGAQIRSGSIRLPAAGRNSFTLTDPTDGFPETAGIRGTVEFETPPKGRISVLGVRGNAMPNGPGFALTSQPTLAEVGTGGGAMAHMAAGGGWQTTFTLVNTGPTATVDLSFFGDNGFPIALPLRLPQTGRTATTNNVNQVIPAGGTLIVETQDSESTTILAGSAVLATSGNVSGFAVFRYNPTGQEAVAPLQASNASAYILAFDNAGNLSTGLAIANESAEEALVKVIIRNDMGTEIGRDWIDLPAHGAKSFMLTDAVAGGWPVTAGARGTIEFATPSGGCIAPLGLRFAAIPNGFSITTIPVMER